MNIQNALQKATVPHLEPHATVSLLESGEQRYIKAIIIYHIVQELCESRGGRPGLSVLMSLTVSVDVKQH